MNEASPASPTILKQKCIQEHLIVFRFWESEYQNWGLRLEFSTMHGAPASECADTFRNRRLNGSAQCSIKAVANADGGPRGALADGLVVAPWFISIGTLIRSPSAQYFGMAVQNGEDGTLGDPFGSEQKGKARHTGLDAILKTLPNGQFAYVPHSYTIAEISDQLSMDHPHICRNLEVVFFDRALLARLQDLSKPSTDGRSKRRIPILREPPHHANVSRDCDVDGLQVVGLVSQRGVHVMETSHNLTFVMGTGSSYTSVPRQLDIGGDAASSVAKETFALSRMKVAGHDSASQYSDNFIEDTFDIFRNAFLKHYDHAIRNALEKILGDSMEIWLAPLSIVVKRRFVSVLKERRAETVAPAFHGTPSSNFASIFERGLLIPGQGNNLQVSNGSRHGLGIYTANLDAPWLSKGFCSDSQILVCAVIQSSAVTHVMDAQVVFDAPQVVPLFVGMSKPLRPLSQDTSVLWSSIFGRQYALPLPVPIAITKLLDASLLGDVATISKASKLRIFYTGAPFMLESKNLIDYAMPGWAMNDITSLSLNADAYVQVYFDGQRCPIAIARNQLSTCHPGLPGHFEIGDTVFFLGDEKHRRSTESDDVRFLLFSDFNQYEQYSSMPRGRGSRGKVIGSYSYRKVRVQFDGEMSPVQVFVDEICKASPRLAAGLQASQQVFYTGRRKQQVDYGERGVVLFECDATCLMVKFKTTRMDVRLSDLSLQKPSGPLGLHKGCAAFLNRTIRYVPKRNNLWRGGKSSFFDEMMFFLNPSFIHAGTVGEVVGIVSENEVLMRFDQYVNSVNVNTGHLTGVQQVAHAISVIQSKTIRTGPTSNKKMVRAANVINLLVHETIDEESDKLSSLAQITKAAKQRRQSEKIVQTRSNKREKQSQSRGSAVPLASTKRALRHGFSRGR